MKAGKYIKTYLKKSFQKSHVITGVTLAFLVGSALLYAGQLTDSLITFYEGNIASANDVNTNFELLSNAVDKDREGLACEMNPGTTITSAAIPFVCDTMLAGDASSAGSNLSFTPSDGGIFQIHRYILLSGTSGSIVDTQYNTVYIGGTSVSDNGRDYYPVSSGQSIEISMEDSASMDYSIETGSYVLVKRIF